MKVILLAAGAGRRFGKRTKTLPKCLIPLPNGENLLSRYLETFRTLHLKKVTIVVGHQKEKIKKECRKKGAGLEIRFIFNKDYRKGSVVSLYKASKELNRDCLIMDADVYFPDAALKALLRSRHKTAFLIDTRSRSTGEEMMLMGKNGRPLRISKQETTALQILGESVGFLKIQKKDAWMLKNILEDFMRLGKTHVEYEESYNALMQKSKLGFEKIDGHFWTEMDFEEDLKRVIANVGEAVVKQSLR